MSVLLSIAKAIIGDGMLRFHYYNNVIKRSESSQYGDAAILKGGNAFPKDFFKALAVFPLLGALYLTPLDRRMDRLCKRKKLVHYVRYMDDIVLLARTRWQLQRAIWR
ncbi:hypothetical protein N9137_01560 [Pseudomonadales bacterium]|nr:hypothetical protein [Pseudomonadales bacterium]